MCFSKLPSFLCDMWWQIHIWEGHVCTWLGLRWNGVSGWILLAYHQYKYFWGWGHLLRGWLCSWFSCSSLLPPGPGYSVTGGICPSQSRTCPRSSSLICRFLTPGKTLQICRVILKNTQMGIFRHWRCPVASFTFSIFFWSFGLLLTILFQACLTETMHK